MKKTLLVVTVLSSLGVASAVQAAPNEMTFIGAVSTKTCEIVPVVGGAVNNLLDLGVVTVSESGATVPFEFKVVNSVDCPTSNTEKLTMQWSGPLVTEGIKAEAGSAASDSIVELIAKNTEIADTKIGKSTDKAIFLGTQVVAGMKYTARLIGGTEIGNFRTAAAYSVSYR